MRFSNNDVRRFAAWSRDRNPLHLDPEFARQTHFGQPIVHGVLTVLEALRSVAPQAGAHPASSLDIEFRGAVQPETSYAVGVTAAGDSVRIDVGAAGTTVLSILAEGRAAEGVSLDADLSWVPACAAHRQQRDAGGSLTPAPRTIDELQRGVEVVGVYTVDSAADVHGGTRGIAPLQAHVLALCSYVTGMELPGLQSLFTRITLQFGGVPTTPGELWYRAKTLRVDPQFRLLETRLDVVAPDGRTPLATGLLRSYVPFSPSSTDLTALAGCLVPETDRLRGTVALVCGGTRGLGADLTASLALAGCHVYASGRRADDAARELQRSLAERGGHVQFLHGDAGDLAWCQSALETIRSRDGRLDLLVLNACAPPSTIRLAPGSAERHERYLRDNLRLVEVPLVTCAEALNDSHGGLILVSSSAVQDPPPGWGHYVGLKQAAEALVQTASREYRHIRSLIARPPMLRTRWNDTPARVAGALAPHQAAARIVNCLAAGLTAGGVELLSEFPVFESSKEPERAPDRAPQADFTVRIAASFTTEPLLPSLRFWLGELELNAHIDVAPYGQVLQSLLDPASLLNRPGRGLNVVLLRVRDWLRELPEERAGAPDLVRDYLDETARDFARAMRSHRAHAPSDTLLILCPSSGPPASTDAMLLQQTERGLAAELGDVPGLQVTFASDYHPRYGITENEIADPLRDRIAHIPYRDAYIHTLSTIVARHVHGRTAPPRKVVVVDCDNTLWRGVVGEVGPEGLEIDEGHRALHQTLSRLAQSGLIVCLCSKNEEADVWRVFESRPDLLLRRDQVVAAMINWLPKSQNLRTLAGRLNLGLDSFIVIDDNPVECAEVRTGCPEVLTLEWPQDTARALALLNHTWELDAPTTTSEDRRRTELYREEFRRQELRAALTFADFIKSLELVVEIAPLGSGDLRRASQLTLRTNQFNFTTIRRDEAELQGLISGGAHDIRTVRVRDRFGDYGLVGLVIAERHEHVWSVDTFLLSCRVLGRGVEHRVVAELARTAAAAGARAVKLRVETTKRNTPARTFLEAISPPELRAGDASLLECEIPSATLAAVRFEPAAAGDLVATEESSTAVPAHAIDIDRIRRRERQIVRTAFELPSPDALSAAVEGRSASAAGASPDDADIAGVVEGAFASGLRMPVTTVRELDALEALGCDSLRIVEITVALSARYPWLPSTLLFEHRSVSQIVAAIQELSNARVPARPAVMVASGPAGADAGRKGAGADVAVVGLHLRCAGAHSPGELWDLLSSGRAAVEPVPRDRRHFLHPLDDTRPHWAGLLEDVGRFDAEFFGVSPREAEVMDPQLRLFLEVAWGALEDAGCAGTEHDPDTGVFAGVMYGDYGFRANLGPKASETPYRCWEGFSLANRLSQLLGFRGPSLAIDTACSSSGTALHLACGALRAGDCRMALVGGVNLILDPDRFGSLGRLGILSSRGRCEPFGADADGTVLGEGAGVVVLRPLEDALRRGDRIYGVIKSTGLSTGSGTVGFTAPNPQAQAEAIRRALRAAGVDPRTISYVETHGTGTALGDPIEVRGLTLAYGSADLHDGSLSLTHRCTLGSIKPNIGHLEAGAGVLSLIKVLLQLERGTLLPSITSSEPNPQIAFGHTPFDVQRRLETWGRPVARSNGASVMMPRRAGLSSFGVGGANAHIIVEEAPDHVGAGTVPEARDADQGAERPAHIVALSARSAEGLRRQADSLKQYLAANPDTPLADMCFSVNTGRRHFEHRLALPARTREDLLESLESKAHGREGRGGARTTAVRAGSTPKVAFLFTGQGCQYPGMGRHLYETQPVFRDALDRCASILDTLLDRPLLELLFAAESAPEAELLHQTGYTQPALFAFEYAVSELWRSWGVQPDFVLGHSVGEIAAMCVAGGVSLHDGLRLIAARGRLMQALPAGGTMASVMAEESRGLEAIAGFEDCVAIAAVNAPTQVVISGAGTAIAEIVARLTAGGIRTKTLTVSHAFHSPLMKPMLAEYERVVREIGFSVPRIPFVSGVDGVLAMDDVTRPEYWVRQIVEPVRFAAGIETLRLQQLAALVEVGPQPVLLGMGRQCMTDEQAAAIEWLPSMRKDVDVWQTLLESLASLYGRGASVDWKAFDAPHRRRRVSVPTYAFGGKHYWLKELPRVGPNPRSGADVRPAHHAPTGSGGVESPADQGARLYEIAWREQPAPNVDAHTLPNSRDWVIFADEGGAGAELARVLAADGARTTRVVRGDAFAVRESGCYVVNPGEARDLERLRDTLTQGRAAAPRVLYLWGLDAPANDALTAAVLPRHAQSCVETAANVVKSFANAEGPPPALWFVTRGAVSTNGSTSAEPVSVVQSLLWGFGRTVALEHPELWGGLIDISAGEPRPDLSALARELSHACGEDQVALRNGTRYVARLAPRAPRTSTGTSIDNAGTYLITGGTGALGLHVARWLVSRGARHLVLASRRGAADSRVEAAIRSLQQRGAQVTTVAADVSRAEDLDRLVSSINANGAPLRGIVHAAGVDTTVSIREMSAGDIHAVLAPKAAGAWLLHERTQDLGLNLFVCFSSLAAVLGAQGRGHYAAANAFLDALTHERRRLGLPATSIDWAPWKGGGMADGDLLEQFERIGNRGLDPDQALQALELVVTAGDVQTSVVNIDWNRFRRVYEARRARPILSEIAVPATEDPTCPGAHQTDGCTLEDGPTASDAALPIHESGDLETAAWRRHLRQMPEGERLSGLESLLRHEVADTLGFDDPESVPLDQSFYSIGMDSLMMADLISRLNRHVGMPCSGLVLDHPEVRSLTAALFERVSRNDAGVPSPAAGADGLDAAGSSRSVASGADADTTGHVGRHDGPITGYDPAAEPEILEFQGRVFPERRPDVMPAHWRWQFCDSARRLGVEPRVWLYRDGGRIVGQMASIPVRVKIGDEERHTGWLVDSMVLEDFRDQAVGSRLLMAAHHDQPFSLSLGQTAHVREILFRLGWRQVAPLETAQCLVRAANVLRSKLPAPAAWLAGVGLGASTAVRTLLSERPRLEVRTIERFGAPHDRLWATAARDVTCAVVRDSSYLNWKYVDQPVQRFLRLELSDDSGVRGVAVWMFKEPDAIYHYRRACLVDLVAPFADEGLLQHVIRASCTAAIDTGADALLCLHIDRRLTDGLRACGFHLRRPERFLLVDPGPLSGPALEHALSPTTWYVTQGDSDIDRPW